MPTFRHGKNAYLALGTVGDEENPADISDSLDDIGFPETSDAAESTTFGQGANTYVLGVTDATFSISGKWNADVDEHLGALPGHETPVSFEYGPAGNGDGLPRYTGKAYVTSYEVSSPVGDVVSLSLDLQVTGPVTRDTFSA